MAAPAKDKLSVLVVEDEKAIRDLLKFVLSNRYELEFHSVDSAQALKEFMATPKFKDIHIAFVDNSLEGEGSHNGTGHASIPEMLKANPRLGVIAMSGSSERRTQAEEEFKVPFLPKPFYPQEAVGLVEKHRREMAKKHHEAMA